MPDRTQLASDGTDEALLVQRARSGDRAAYDELVRRHRPAAYRAALSITGDADEAEDATQDACIKAYLALAAFKPGSAFRPWLLQIAVNEARNRRRSGWRRAKAVERAALNNTSSGRIDAEPELATLESERREALRSALSALRPTDRALVGARYFFSLSEAEMAGRLGLARGTIKSRLSRALARLRTAMAAAALALLVLLIALLALSRDARDAVADRLGLSGVNIVHLPTSPTAIPTTSPAAVVPPNLGSRVSLEQARSSVDGRLLMPTLDELGSVQAAYVQGDADARLITLVFAPPPGWQTGDGDLILFAQLEGSLDPAVIEKGLAPGSTATAVSIGGSRGFWLAGKPHSFVFRDHSGQYRQDAIRLAGNTLLWEGGAQVLLRLEGTPTLEQALRVAASVREAAESGNH